MLSSIKIDDLSTIYNKPLIIISVLFQILEDEVKEMHGLTIETTAS